MGVDLGLYPPDTAVADRDSFGKFASSFEAIDLATPIAHAVVFEFGKHQQLRHGLYSLMATSSPRGEFFPLYPASCFRIERTGGPRWGVVLPGRCARGFKS